MHALNEPVTARNGVAPDRTGGIKNPHRQLTNCRGFVLQSEQKSGGLLPEISAVRCKWFINPTHCLMFGAFFTGNVFAQQVNKKYTCWKPSTERKLRIRCVGNRRSSTLPSRTGTLYFQSVVSLTFQFTK